MAGTFKITNPVLTGREKTYLSSDYSSGANLSVRNNDGFTTQWFAVVGEPAQEQTETKDISSLSGNATIVLSGALKFSHPKSAPVYLSQFDKVSVERTVADGSSWSEITNSPFNLEWDDYDHTTTIYDASGGSAYDYRWRFYNSVTATYSSYSGTLPGSGLSKNQAGYIIKMLRENPITEGISDSTMYRFMSDFQELVYEEIPTAWWFLREGTQISTVASTYKYSISSNWSDLLSIKFVMYRYISGSSIDDTYPLSYLPPIQFYNYKADANEPTDDRVRNWSILPPDGTSAKGYIALDMTPKTADCYLFPIYYIDLTAITAFSDTLIVPRPKGYIDYVLYRIYDDIRQDSVNADKYQARVSGTIIALKRRNRRQSGQRELTRFRGHRGWSKYYGEFGKASTRDYYRENYW